MSLTAPVLPLTDPQRHRLLVIGSYVEAHCWSVARLPGNDESLAASSYTRECAGKGLAVALGAHRLGAAVEVLLGIGEDHAGEALLALLAHEGLSERLVYRLGAYSGQGCGLLGAQGQSSVIVFPGANALLGPSQWAQAATLLPQTALLYAQLEAPAALVLTALQQARAAGARTVLNLSPRPPDTDANALSTLCAAADVLVVNRVEAAALSTAQGLTLPPDPRHWSAQTLAACWLRWPQTRWLVVTLGEQGCMAFERNGAALNLPGHAVAAVQPIGAGDAFSAGLCAALAKGAAMEHALQHANACGAYAASHPGLLASLPRQSALSDWLAALPQAR